MGLLDDTLQKWGVGMLNGAPIPTGLPTQPAPFGFDTTAQDMIQQARARLAAIPLDAAPNGGNSYPTSFDARQQRLAQQGLALDPGDKTSDPASRLVAGAAQDVATIGPVRRLMDANAYDTEHFGDAPMATAPAAETAMMLIGGAGAVPAEASALRSGLTGSRAAGDLAMDQASRMARAKEMGFRTNMPLYHGTDLDFDTFKAIPTDQAGFQSPGVSSALDPEMANEFAVSRGNVPANQPPGATSGASQVYKLLHRADRPVMLNLTGDEAHHEVVSTLQDAFDRGHDAVMLRNYTSPGGRTGDIIIVKNANQLRSPNAAFDPAKKDSGFLLGSGATDSAISAALQAANADDSARNRQ
jgi:hypothetical protein